MIEEKIFTGKGMLTLDEALEDAKTACVALQKLDPNYSYKVSTEKLVISGEKLYIGRVYRT